MVGALFPLRGKHTPLPMAPQPAVLEADHNDDDVVPEVTGVELRVAIRRLQAKKFTTPGPDDLPGKAWILALTAFRPRLEGLLGACLVRGQIPRR